MRRFREQLKHTGPSELVNRKTEESIMGRKKRKVQYRPEGVGIHPATVNLMNRGLENDKVELHQLSPEQYKSIFKRDEDFIHNLVEIIGSIFRPGTGDHYLDVYLSLCSSGMNSSAWITLLNWCNTTDKDNPIIRYLQPHSEIYRHEVVACAFLVCDDIIRTEGLTNG